MKKLLLLILTTIMMMMAVTSLSADPYTIGTGTSTEYYIPSYPYYDYNWSRVIYTKAEINAAGWTEADTLTGFAFDISSMSTDPYENLYQKIYVRHTSATAMVSDYVDPTSGGWTLVYDDTYTYSGTGWQFVPFSTVFVYNNTDNLEILWEDRSGDYFSGYPYFRYTSTSPTYLAAYKYQDNTFPAVSGTLYYNRPNIQLHDDKNTPPLSGAYTINPLIPASSTNFQTFSAAVRALNNFGITSSVTFSVKDDQTFNEDIPPLTATGTSSYPITFVRSGDGTNNPVVVPIVNQGAITIMGGDYITFNGIDVTSPGGTDVDYGYDIRAASGTNGAQYNHIINCKITMDRANTASYGIYQYYTTPTSAAGANSYNEYAYITIESSYNGIRLYGSSAASYPETGNVIRYCTIGGDSAGDIGPYGIYLYYQEDILVRNNEIKNQGHTSTTYGIYDYYGKGTNHRIYNNKIHDLAYTGTSTSSLYGMYIYMFTTGAHELKLWNNMIYNLSHGYTSSSSSFYVYGIYMYTGGSSNIYNIDFNSVRIDGPTTCSSAALYLSSSTGAYKIRNNVLSNFAGATTTPYHVCLYSASATGVGSGAGSISDRNVMYLDNTTGGYYVRGSTTNYASLSAWTTASTFDANSRDSNPQFVSASDLHIQTGIPTPVESKASYFSGAITWVTTDIDGQARTAEARTAPDIGADEGAFDEEVIVQTPTAQPTALVFDGPYSTSLSGSFTEASPAAENYLVVRHNEALDGAPVDQTTYVAGNLIGTTGTVVPMTSATSFNATGLQVDSLYYFTIYSYNSNGLNGPKYLTTSPLTGNIATLPTPPAAPDTFLVSRGAYNQIDFNSDANANGDSILVVWNTENMFGTPLSDGGYVADDPIAGGGTVLYVGEATGLGSHTNLSSATTYYYRSYSWFTSGDYKTYSTSYRSGSAFTPVFEYPFVEGFESGFSHASALAGPYTQESITGTSNWTANTSLTSYNRTPRTGSWNAYLYYNNTRWLFREYQLDADSTYRFSMFARDYNASGVTLEVAYGTTGTAAGMTNPIVASTGIIDGDYQKLSGVFSPASSGIYYIGILGTMNPSGTNYLSIDDIEVKVNEPYPLEPEYPSPALAAIDQNVYVNLGWANQGTVTKVDVYFSSDSTLVATLDSSVRVATNQTSPLNAYVLPFLDYATHYFWKVVCKDDIARTTAEGPLWDFTTMDDPTLALPFSEPFASTSDPIGWIENFTTSSTSYYGNPAPGFYKYTSSSTSGGYAQMPQLGPITSYTVLEFDYKLVTSAYSNTPYSITTGDSVKILVSTDYGQTFDLYTSINSTNHVVSGDWARYSYVINNGGAVADDRVVIRIENTYETGVSSSYYFLTDNFAVFSPPSEAVYDLTPTFHDFGQVDLTDVRQQEFTLTNLGLTDFIISDISLTGDAYFTLVDTPTLPDTLGYAEIATFKVQYAPTVAGSHSTTLSITDDVTRTVHTYTDSILGVGVAPVALPYSEDFEARHSVVIGPTGDEWVVGALAKPTQLTAPHGGVNAITTRSLTGTYLASEDSYVYLPNLDISGLTAEGVIVSFWNNFYFETGWDAGVLEYSVDLGNTWTRVDSLVGTGGNYMTDSSYNWYNSVSTSGPIGPPKWSGRSNTYTGESGGWIQSGTLIPNAVFTGAPGLKLRFHFGSDSSGNYEGWAIDDILVVAQPIYEYALSNYEATPLDYKFSGDTVTFSVTVTNNGFDTAGVYVSFLIDDVVIDSVATGVLDTWASTVVEYQHVFASSREYGTLYDLSATVPDDELNTNNSAGIDDVRVFNGGWLAEGFEGDFLPSKWLKWGIADFQEWVKGTTHYDGAYGAETPVFADSISSFLATPKIDIVTGDSLFFWAKASVTGPQIQLRYNATADTSATWTAFGSPIDLTTTDSLYAVDLSSLNGTQYRFAFEAVPNSATGTVYLDRVIGPIIYIPTEAPGPVVMISPADRVEDVDPRTITLDWDVPLSGGEPEGYAVFIGTVNDTTLVDTYTNYADVFPPNSSYTPYTATPSYLMDYDTDYYWMVVPYNGFGNPILASCPIYKLTTQLTPLSGAWTINPLLPDSTGNNFQSFTSAINYLNAFGVGSGGVTITVYDTTYVENIPAITYNANEDDQVTFVAAPARAKPVIMPAAGIGTLDAIITLNGSDYITFDGFDIKENPANVDGTTQMEFGIYVINNGTTDGASHNTIVNCDITLAATSATRGIYQYATSPASIDGTNSYNKYYDNDLAGCYYGYYLYGNTTYYDQGNEVGAVTDGSITDCIQGVNYNYQQNLQIFNQDIVLQGGAIPAYAYGVYGSVGALNTVAVYGLDITQASQSTASGNDINGIYISANTAANIHDNLIYGFSSTGTSAYIYGIYVSQGAAKQINYIYNNDVYDITTASSIIYGIRAYAAAPWEVYGNNVYNITNTYSGTFYGYYIGYNSSLVDANIYDNTLHDINVTSTVYGMYIYYGLNMNTYNNQIYNVTTSGTSTLYGLYSYYGTSASVKNTYNNEIHGLSGGGIIYAMSIYYGATQNAYKNKVYDITYTGTSTSSLYGVYLYGSSSTTYINFYNNFVYDLKAPNGTSTTGNIHGIYTTTAKLINVWNNTVYLNASGTSANFGSNAMYLYSGASVDMRNNIFVNKSTPGASGVVTAFRKGAAGFTNVADSTNKNIYYAGTPSATNPIFVYSTTVAQTIDDYLALIATKDQLSATEDVPFLGGSRVIDLHIDPSVATFVESNGLPIWAVTDDIDDDPRNATTPDIGADEGTFTPLPPVEYPLAQPTNLALVPASTFINGTFDISDADKYLVVQHVVDPLGAYPYDLVKYAVGDTVGVNGTVVAKVSAGAFESTGLVPDSLYYYTIFAFNDIGAGGPLYLVADSLTGNISTLPVPPDNPAAFTATTASYEQINLAATANAAVDPILVAWNTTNTFGTPVSTETYINGDPIDGGGTVHYVGDAASLTNHTGLDELTTYYYKAWSYATSGIYKVYSTGMTSNAATTMAPINPPYEHTFEGTFPPTGWTRYSGLIGDPTVLTTGTRWIQDDWLNVSGSPNDAARVNIYSTYKDWFITPQFNIPDTSYKIKFDLCYTDYGNSNPIEDPLDGLDDRFIVLVGDGDEWYTTDAIKTYDNTGSPDVMNSIPNTGVSVTIPLTGVSGLKYIAFYSESTVSNEDNDLMIDNFKIYTGDWDDYGITNLAITPLYKFEDVPIDIDFRVTNYGDVTTGKKVYLMLDTTVVDSLEVGTLATGNYADLNFNYTVDTPGTYDITVYVPADVDNDNNSAVLADQAIYTTGQLAEGFEGTFVPSRWLNWGYTGYNWWTQGTTPGDGGVGNAQLVIADTLNTYAHLSTPRLNIQAGDSLRFLAKSSTAGRQIQMKYTAAVADTTTASWTNLGSPITLTTGYTEYVVDISSLVARGIYRLAFNGLPNGATGTIYVDKVVGPIKYIPNEAPGPVVLTDPANDAMDIDPRTVTMHWDEPSTGGNPDSYNVYVSDDIGDMTGQYSFSITAPVRQVTPYTYGTPVLLDYNTKWYWLVQPSNTYGTTPIGSCTIDSLTTKQQLSAATTLNLGSVYPGLTKSGTIAVTNEGPTELTYTAVGTDFTFGSRFTLAADSTYNLPFEFTAPGTEQAYVGLITLTETSPGASTVEIDVTADINRTLQIGDGTSELTLPIEPYYKYSYSQSVYLASEIDLPAPKKIEKIYYQYSGYEAMVHSVHWKIWMMNTDRENYAGSGESWAPTDSMSMVFDGTIATVAGAPQWIEIILDTPFVYDSSKNLLVAVNEPELSTSYDNTASYFYCTDTAEYRAIRYYSDSTAPDPYNPTITATSKLGYPNLKINLSDLSATAVFAVTPDSLDFGDVEQYSTSAAMEFVVTDEGVPSYNVTSVYVEGDDAAEFTVTATGLPVEVGIFTPYTFTVEFNPTTTGAKSTTLKIVDDISARVINTVPLTGNATPETIGNPINLAASVSNYNDVTLTWGMNSGLANPPWIGWDNGTNSSNWGIPDDTEDTLDVAIKFSTDDLARYSGYELQRIKFYAHTYTGNTYRVRVWEGADSTITPTTLVVDEAVPSYTVSDWNEVVLSTPYTFTGSEAVWIGFYVETTIQAYPMPADNGVKVANKGSLYSRNGGNWVSGAATAGNWNIEGYIAEVPPRGISSSRPLSIPVTINNQRSSDQRLAVMDPRETPVVLTRDIQGFNVYRDDVQINTGLVTSMTYLDEDLPNDTYDYYVEAVYYTGTSAPSNTVQVEINKPLPYSIPFTENWSSSSFDTQLWTKDTNNWVISAATGNPLPGVRFDYDITGMPYNSSLTSWDIDATGMTDLKVKYDIRLDTATTGTLEELEVEVYDGADWQVIDSFDNSGGDIAWISKDINVSAYVANSIFQLRFRAHGLDSSTLWYWAVDNVKVEEIVIPDPPVVSVTLVSGDIVLDWDDVADAVSYKVYASDDAYAAFPGGWDLVGSPVVSTYTHVVGANTYKFFRVVSVGGARAEVLSPPLTKPVNKKINR